MNIFSQIKTPAELNGLIIETYIIAIIVAVVFMGIGILVSNLIPYEGGVNPKDQMKRRVLYIIIGFLAISGFFMYNQLSVVKNIVLSLAGKFTTTVIIATAAVFIIYFGLGFVVSKLMKTSKFGTVYNFKKKA
ncbi:MAG: hypothetical protein ACOYN6_03130 [Ignavibacteria bacterium]